MAERARPSKIGFMLRIMRGYLPYYVGGSVLLGVTLWMTLSIPHYLQGAIDELRAHPDPSGSPFLHDITMILVFASLVIFTRTASRLLFFYPGRMAEFDLKNRMLTKLLRLQRDFYLKHATGSIISRINNDITGVRMMLGFGLLMVLNSVATLSFAPAYMFHISPRLTLYCVLPILAAFGVLQWGMWSLRGQQMRQMRALQDLSDFTVESYNGIDVLKSFRHHAWIEGRFRALSDDVKDSAIKMSNFRAYLMPVLTHITNALKVMLVFVGGIMVVEGGMTMGEFLAYALYLAMLLMPLMGLTFLMFLVQRGLTSLTSLMEILGTEPELPAVSADAEARLPAQLAEGLSVRGLTFAYADAPEAPALHDLSFDLRPGELVGVFGPIGSGKTTLVNVLNRYLTPPPGTVRLDGVDAAELSQATVRRHIVTVTQEPFLFSETVGENIGFGTDDRAEIAQAAQSAALADDVAHLPGGLDTLVGEKGITLSGGQKQRISLARALMKQCDLLILDDVLSAVDHETERFLIEQIYSFRQARSLLIVSHRTSVLERAQRILVLEDGRITASGSHAELIQQPGVYRQSWLLQREQPDSAPDDQLPPGAVPPTNGGSAAPRSLS
jgi:ATP-binding cassette, subfamily B, multidrug efflux pump